MFWASEKIMCDVSLQLTYSSFSRHAFLTDTSDLTDLLLHDVCVNYLAMYP